MLMPGGLVGASKYLYSLVGLEREFRVEGDCNDSHTAISQVWVVTS